MPMGKGYGGGPQGKAPGAAKSGASYSSVIGRPRGTGPTATAKNHGMGQQAAGNGSAQLDFKSGSSVPKVPRGYPNRPNHRSLPSKKGGADI